MSIQVGKKLPQATLLEMTAEGPAQVNLSEEIAGKTVVIFGLPGAFTGTCSTAHVPSFMRTKAQFDAAGVDAIYCVSVNDPFVMGAWAKNTGADAAGLRFVGDVDAAFTKAMGLDFSAPPVGLIDRSIRYAMVVRDGEVAIVQAEENPGVCDRSSGEALLEALTA